MAPSKRSYSTFRGDAPARPVAPTKSNAFTKLMKASKQQSHEYTNAPDLSNWLQFFEQEIEKREMEWHHDMNDYVWTRIVTESIVSTAENMIAAHHITSKWTHVKTKVSALHALVEMAVAVAHAPNKEASADVRKGRAPGFLMDKIFQILESMDEKALQSVAKEEAFLFKVKKLRPKSKQEVEISRPKCDDSIWSDLDDIPRLLKAPGPIDFRRCSKRVKRILEGYEESSLPGIKIVKVIRNEICAEVSRSTCYETKYKALNALVVICNYLLQKPLRYDEDPELVRDALSEGLLQVARTMTDKEISIAVAELENTPELSPINLNEFIAEAYSKNSYKGMLKIAQFVGTDIEFEPGHGRLLAKILRLRGYVDSNRVCWESDDVSISDRLYFALEDIIEIFIDNSVPLRCSHFLERINAAFDSFRHSYHSSTKLERAGGIIFHTIKQLSSRAGRRACFETKLNTFKALMQTGVRIVSFRLEHKSGVYNRFNLKLFEDGRIEASLTDALLAICRSWSQEEWDKVISDQTFCNAIIKLNDTRKSAPGALPGLPAVVELINKPSVYYLGKIATSVGMVDVIDLSAD